MLEFLLESFLETGEVKKAQDCIDFCLDNNHLAIADELADFFTNIYPNNPELVYLKGVIAMRKGDYEKAYEQYESIFSESRKTLQTLIGTCVPHFKDKYIFYNQDIVTRITSRTPSKVPLITLTITTCKRYELFEKTINSFLNTCLDLEKIDHWLCIDDNSSTEDREKMQEKYPFFEFYFKEVSEKGHPQSMNIIRNKVKTPFLFHMEDDWTFFAKKRYISDCLEILSQDEKIGQCLINRNYGETHEHRAVSGGFERCTPTGLKYYIHEHCATDDEYKRFYAKYGNGMNCAYWPHFSFRPSLMKRKVLDREFNTKVSHFERKYADDYHREGYYSVFFPTIYCMHTGRLTAEINDQTKLNAYILNGEKQFTGKEEQTGISLKSFVINLERRPDRWEKFKTQSGHFDRFHAVDGDLLVPTEQLQRIFDGNDYNMRPGLVGCAMSHIFLYTNLVEDDVSAYLIVEDDVQLTKNFFEKVQDILSETKNNFDICMLGHHVWPSHRTPELYDQELSPTAEQWNSEKSFKISIGGTSGYIITKKGALKMLTLINKTGMTNGIDTMIQKFADHLTVYYCTPHLVFAECHVTQKDCDSDIQYNFKSLTIPTEERYKRDVAYFSNFGMVITTEDFEAMKTYCNTLNPRYFCMIYKGGKVKELLELCKYPCYPISYDYLVVIQNPPDQVYRDRYFDRLIRYGKYDVTDALIKTASRKIISMSDITHTYEAVQKAVGGTETYPFDSIDGGGVYTILKLTYDVLETQDIQAYVKDLLDTSKNDTKLITHTNTIVFKNRKYGFSLPRDPIRDIQDIYTKRFENLKNTLTSGERVGLIFCTRWPEIKLEKITNLYDRLEGVCHDIKILIINTVDPSETIPEKYTRSIAKITVPFPLHFMGQEWTHEKIKFDQTVFRVAIQKPISRFLEIP
jgi:GR25 family glycosyltransferase involved in LPS biosynthesis